MDNDKDKNTKKRTRIDPGKILNLLLVLALVAVLVVGLVYYRQEKGREENLDLTRPYDTGAMLPGDATGKEAVRTAEPFSESLCVADGTENPYQLHLSADDEKGLLFDVSDKKALYAQGIFDRIYPASLTKIMTAILALEKGNMTDQVTITDEDVTLEAGSQLSGLVSGDTVTMDQLFHALMIYSANDAAMAIARHIGGSVDAFVDMMNEKAKALGMTGTHFVNPHGLHDDNHYTTAYDIYLMLGYAVKNGTFANTMQMDAWTLNATSAAGTARAIALSSTDQYLSGHETAPQGVTVLGGKTGTTDQAGSCLAILTQNGYGKLYISIVLHARNKTVLYQDMNQLLGVINR